MSSDNFMVRWLINSRCALAFALTISATNVVADRLDDTHLYRSFIEDAAPMVDPNVLFIFDTSGSMNTDIPIEVPINSFFDNSGTTGATTYSVTGASLNFRQVIGFGPFMVVGGTEISASVSGATDNVGIWLREDSQPNYNDADEFDGYGTSPDVVLTVSGNSAVYIAVSTTEELGSTFNLTVTYNGSDAAAPIISDQTCECENDGTDWDENNFCSWDNAWVNTGSSRMICDEKLDLMKDAADSLLSGLSGVNVGLMRFRSDSSGGYILHAVNDVDEGTNRADLRTVVNELEAGGGAPLAETLYEAWRYYSGDSEYYGYNSSYTPDVDGDAFASGTATSDGDYETPITEQCQSNNIVLLTNGQPYSDGGRDSAISDLDGVGTCGHSSPVAADGSSSCLDEMAGYLQDNEHIDSMDDSNVTTHTVGFDVDTTLQNFLEVVASDGRGQAYEVDSADSLLDAFESIILDIFSDSGGVVAPAVTVDVFNVLQHRDEVYYAIFKPSIDPRWQGNVKKFKLEADGDLLDANGVDAVDEATGFFADTAQSFWAADADGADIAFGGIAEKLPVARTVYTLMTDTPGSGGSLAVPLTTTLVDAADMGVTGVKPTADDDENYSDNLVGWALGAEGFQDPGDYDDGGNHFIGDPLHARPFVVTYGGTEASPVDRLFAMTNLGFLHVVNPLDSSGIEQWSFIPNDLLPNIRRYADPDSADDGKAYGLDGSILPWVSDEDNDGIDAGRGDFVYLALGMRRGGTNYYMLDATELNSAPAVLWQINGPDIPNDYEYDASTQAAIDSAADVGFRDLGQTWSEPRRTQVYFECADTDNDGFGDCDDSSVRNVIFFTGGYDPRHDENTIINPSVEITDQPEYGNAVYMVDAVTGNLLWSGGNNADARSLDNHDLPLALTHSIPASPGFADVDGDGLTDIVIVVDITGDVWRIDINSATTDVDDFATGGKIFSLASTAERGDFLRFYNKPDIVLSRPRGGPAFINIVMGSGYRANPRGEDLEDRLYVLHEYDIFGLPVGGSGDPIYTETAGSSLYFYNDTDSDAEVDRGGSAVDGYFRKLTGIGEKVLQPTITLHHIALFTTYLPNGPVGGNINCSDVSLGRGQVYALDIESGESALSSETLALNYAGIPTEPSIIFVENDSGVVKPVVSFGAEVFGEGDELSEIFGNVERVFRSYWREN